MNSKFLVSVLLAVGASGFGLAAHASPEVELVQKAGAEPTQAQVEAVILDNARKVLKDPSSVQAGLRIVSGPRLATGMTYAGNFEQAWLVCTVVKGKSPPAGYPDPEVQTYWLRNKPEGVMLVTDVSWKEVDRNCKG